MKLRWLFTLVAAAVLVVFGSQWATTTDPSPAPADPVPVPTQSLPAPASPAAVVNGDVGSLIVPDVAVRDTDGRIAWRGDVDLAPTLERIEAGERDPHRNDGGVFGNRERLLPARPAGYYHEYVVRTPGISHAGPQRLVIGAEGEVYYTSDHYVSFLRVR